MSTNPGPNVTSTPLLTQVGIPVNPSADSSGDGFQVGSSASEPVGFWGKTPTARPASAGNVHTVTAGSTTAVFVNTSFDGTTGTTAYTIGDIVAILKAAGILAP